MITKASDPLFLESGKGYTPAARRKLDEILEYEKIGTVFQPIVSLENGSILGYEVLSRGPEGLESPDALFSMARVRKAVGARVPVPPQGAGKRAKAAA